MAKQVLSRGPEQAGWLTALASAPRSNNAPPFWSWLAERVEPGASCPQASPEVEVARFPSQRRGETYVLKQPRAGSYLRLTPEEHFIWRRLDGRPVRQILADYFDQYGCFAPGLVLDLINRLRQAQMLTEPPRPLYAGLADRLRRRGWGWRAEQLLRGLLLYERTVPGFNRAATLLYQAGGWLLFTRPAPFLLVALVLLGLGVYLSLVQRVGFEVVTTGGSFALGFLVFTAANALASLVVELGRALATVHHGCEVRAGGLRVLLAMPSFYLDTRDIWMEDRRARMRVAVAGSGALLTSASLAALVLALTPAGPFTDFLFKFALLCYGTTLFYLNPLVKLDGYTLLSEWLEEPDLQERSLVFLRSGLFRKLRTGQRLHRREQAQAGFGALVVVWTLYTALGGLYFVAWRALAGLDELWRHDQPQMRFIGIAGTIALGSGLALGGALLLLRLLTQSYRWAERRGLLTDAPRLAIGAVGVALPLGLAAALLPVPPDVYRGLVAPPLLMVALISASRLAREYDGARLRWFFVALAGYAVLVFVKEELDALRALVQLDPTWTLWVDRSVSLLGPLLCLPFGFWLASLVTSRYRVPITLLGGGIGLYGLQALLPPGPVAAVLATTGVGLLTAGLLIYQILHRRWRTVRTLDALPLADDASRLADSMRTLVAQLLDDLVAQSGRRAVDQLQARFNLAAEQAGWDLSLRELRLEEVERRDLLSAAPVYRQALVLLLDEAAARSGRPFVERALGRAWDAIPWDRREVVDAWVLGKLAWGGVGMNRAVGKQVDRLRFLRRVPIFAGLDEVELRQIAEAFEERRARVGARIIRQGEPGDTYYLIRSGVVEVLKRNGNQAEAVVARLGEGDGFGELALLYEQPRSASIRALTPVELLALRRADFDRLLRERFSLLDKLGPTLERERLLAAIPLFGGLSPRELSMLTRSLAEVTVEPGQAVVRQGAAGDSFYLVVTGRLAVTVEDPTGAARTVAHLGPGEYFGEMALLHDRPRSATVRAELPSRLLVLHKAEFDRLLWRQNSANRDLQLVASRRRLDLAAKLGAQ